jgi:hypothetical protein
MGARAKAQVGPGRAFHVKPARVLKHRRIPDPSGAGSSK